MVAPPVPRLPGVRFPAAPTPPDPVRILPRMDIAAFVGIAERGPVDQPVPVEDLAGYTLRFGGDVVLGWDPARGEPVTAQLRPAVEAFFRNGGRRCWIVRVAVADRDAVLRDPDLTVGEPILLDRDLATVPAARLLAEAQFLRFGRPVEGRLRGIHALLPIEEVSLLAVPDAGHPAVVPAPADPGQPIEDHPNAPDEPTGFAACRVGPPGTPHRVTLRRDDAGRPVALRWPAVAGATGYRVERTSLGDAWSPVLSPTLDQPTFALGPLAAGAHRFRVQAIGPGGEGAPSAPLRVDVGAVARDLVERWPDPGRLVAVHTAVLRLCAARGDVFGVLSLPEGSLAADAIAHAVALRDADSEGLTLSHGALVHPWLVTLTRSGDPATDRAADAVLPAANAVLPAADTVLPAADRAAVTRRQAPDGAIVGLMAARAASRGAWVAPANVPLRDVVALADPLGDADVAALHAAGLDAVRQTPAGFLALAAQTLSTDRALRPINVRRLLDLLRRLALLHGAQLAFEPHGEALRRRVARTFEVLLAGLFERGAFAGDRAEDAFRVRVGEPPNSARARDAGQLIVELKVAPSVPLEFLDVRLVRTGERLAVEAA